MRSTIIAAALGFLLSVAALAQTAVHEPPHRMSCHGDKLVWVNTKSGVYHFKGERDYGSTKEGKFICQKQADAEGDRPTKNGQ